MENLVLGSCASFFWRFSVKLFIKFGMLIIGICLLCNCISFPFCVCHPTLPMIDNITLGFRGYFIGLVLVILIIAISKIFEIYVSFCSRYDIL